MIEEWKDINGYEGIYKISNLGKVFSILKNKELTPSLSKKSHYKKVQLFKDKVGKYFSVHRLVAIHFLDNPENLPEVNHKDENTLNNCVSNLEWCTHKYNSSYGTKSDRCRIAMKNNPNLNRVAVAEIDNYGNIIQIWSSLTEAARDCNCKIIAISRVCNGGYYHTTSNRYYNVSSYKGRKFKYIWKM